MAFVYLDLLIWHSHGALLLLYTSIGYITRCRFLRFIHCPRLCKLRRDQTEWCNWLVPWATWPWQCIYSLATIAPVIKGSSAYLTAVQTIILLLLRPMVTELMPDIASIMLAINVQPQLSICYSVMLLLYYVQWGLLGWQIQLLAMTTAASTSCWLG